MTFCPGKKKPDSITGHWDRDLDADLDAVRSFGAAALVTLMEDHELRSVKVLPDDLRAGVLARGMEWHHLPIVDGSVPDDQFEESWIDSGMRLRNLLTQGRNIVIHCLGGLGRTGMIAARLLVELGLEPELAICRVRAARPGSIERDAQEEVVRNCRRIPPQAVPAPKHGKD